MQQMWDFIARGATKKELDTEMMRLAIENQAPDDGRMHAASSVLIGTLPDGHPQGYWAKVSGTLDSESGAGSMAVMVGTNTP